MTVEKNANKRKAATACSSPKSIPVKVASEPARQIQPRKRAADFLSEDEGEECHGEKTEKNYVTPSPAASRPMGGEAEKPSKKKPKRAAEAPESAVPPVAKITTTKLDSGEEPLSTGKSSKQTKGVTGLLEGVLSQIAEDDEEGSEGEEDDDQAAAFIQGFESSGDEDISGDDGFEPGKNVPVIPDSKKVKRKLRKMKKNATGLEEPGTVYVGRVPHGFYEHEMRAYFSQFGPITRLRLSRNRTTGKSKHFAFLEFASASVAKVVADTMDNYLMFGHILKCKYILKESVHPQLWKGANKRFKRTPWNDIERRRMEAGKTKEKWSKKIKQENARRAKRAEKMKALGYEFEIPALKGVDEVHIAVDGKGGQARIDDVGMEESTNEQEQRAAIETSTDGADNPNGRVADVEITSNKSKKEKKERKDKKDTTVKEAKKAGEVKKIESKSKSKKVSAVSDTPEKLAKGEKGNASLPGAGKSGKGERSKTKKSKA
ncbi:ribosomal biogenesis protein Gar2 [Histoplasma ohiense]|nr:ribosomal biogenesis protein Gar2 [Histoplasma ohiense (nom. inval.)]